MSSLDDAGKSLRPRCHTCLVPPVVFLKNRGIIVWAAGCNIFAYDLGKDRWELFRKALHSQQIRSIEYCEEKQWWIVAGEDKKIVILKDMTFELIGECTINTKITAATCLNADKVAVSDKFGGVTIISVSNLIQNVKIYERYQTPKLDSSLEIDAVSSKDCSELTHRSQPDDKEDPVLGHMSVITVMSASPRWLITGDRDGKVRVSRNPDCHVTEMFCLGHSEFITSMVTPGPHWQDILITASGDCSIRLFSISDGREYDCLQLQASTINAASVEMPGNYLLDGDTPLIPIGLYWIPELCEVLVLIEDLNGFLRVPISSTPQGQYPYQFGCPSVCLLQGAPQALIPVTHSAFGSLDTHPQYAKYLTEAASLEADLYLWWIDMEGRLRKICCFRKGVPTALSLDANSEWAAHDIGEAIAPTKAFYWKNIRESKDEFDNNRRKRELQALLSDS